MFAKVGYGYDMSSDHSDRASLDATISSIEDRCLEKLEAFARHAETFDEVKKISEEVRAIQQARADRKTSDAGLGVVVYRDGRRIATFGSGDFGPVAIGPGDPPDATKTS